MKKLRQITPIKKVQYLKPGVQAYSGNDDDGATATNNLALGEDMSLTVAGRHKETGEVRIGKKGQQHATMALDQPEGFDHFANNYEMGFATPEGKFLNRNDAYNYGIKHDVVDKSKMTKDARNSSRLDSMHLKEVNSDLVVAAKHRQTGQVKTGKPGQMHVDLVDNPDSPTAYDDFDRDYEGGFSDSKGNFLDRKTAYKQVMKKKTGFTPTKVRSLHSYHLGIKVRESLNEAILTGHKSPHNLTLHIDKNYEGFHRYSVKHKGKEVAFLNYDVPKNNVSWKKVDSKYRNQGIATAMHQAVEKENGKQLSPSDSYTEMGRAFSAKYYKTDRASNYKKDNQGKFVQEVNEGERIDLNKEYKIKNNKEFDGAHRYSIHHKNKEIGYATLDTKNKYMEYIQMKPEHQGKGLYGHVLRHIEKHLGRQLEPAEQYTKAGKAASDKYYGPERTKDYKWNDKENAYMKESEEHPFNNTVKAYKLFRTHPSHPGKIFPLFVNKDQAVPMNTWVKATEGPRTGKGKVKSSLGELAFRPGWHSGEYPVATHIGGKSKPNLTKPDYRPANHVWAEVEHPADKDWQSVANSRAVTSKSGHPIASTAHITDQIPFGGHYKYKTNPNMSGHWLISGDMKVNKILSDKEVEDINNKAGVKDLPRLKNERQEIGVPLREIIGSSITAAIFLKKMVYVYHNEEIKFIVPADALISFTPTSVNVQINNYIIRYDSNGTQRGMIAIK